MATTCISLETWKFKGNVIENVVRENSISSFMLLAASVFSRLLYGPPCIACFKDFAAYQIIVNIFVEYVLIFTVYCSSTASDVRMT